MPDSLSMWVHSQVDMLTSQWPEDAWDLAHAVLPILEDDWAVSYVGIDLLEDLIREHASRFIDRLESAVHASPQMALAVSSMWNNAPPVDRRFKALVRSATNLAQP